MAINFCDPHSPWQRGTNENTNGLLRQYFPQGTDPSSHSPERLLEVATEPNARPRKTLGRITPAEALQRLLSKRPSLRRPPDFAILQRDAGRSRRMRCPVCPTHSRAAGVNVPQLELPVDRGGVAS
jgi:hypothetical protein